MRRLMIVQLIAAIALGSAAAADAQTPAPAAAAPAAAPAAGTEPARGLFDPSPRQFQIGGRFSNIDGDAARFQRYQDVGDGVLFTDARYARDDVAGKWLLRA